MRAFQDAVAEKEKAASARAERAFARVKVGATRAATALEARARETLSAAERKPPFVPGGKNGAGGGARSRARAGGEKSSKAKAATTATTSTKRGRAKAAKASFKDACDAEERKMSAAAAAAAAAASGRFSPDEAELEAYGPSGSPARRALSRSGSGVSFAGGDARRRKSWWSPARDPGGGDSIDDDEDENEEEDSPETVRQRKLAHDAWKRRVRAAEGVVRDASEIARAASIAARKSRLRFEKLSRKREKDARDVDAATAPGGILLADDEEGGGDGGGGGGGGLDGVLPGTPGWRWRIGAASDDDEDDVA